jgi:hypothetical protein
MRQTWLVVVLVVVGLLAVWCTTASAAAGASSDVIELNDDNFEHLTQATSGSTTGNWLVELYFFLLFSPSHLLYFIIVIIKPAEGHSI